MSEQMDELNCWLETLEDQSPVHWSRLPDIGLYMDQVQTYIDRQLGLYRRDEQEHLLTPAMVNNYIKDALIPRAEAKKYSPVHLALLIMIATLKQVLSIQNIKQLLSRYRKPDDVAAVYDHFLDVQQQCLRDSVTKIKGEASKIFADNSSHDDPNSDLRSMALELSIEARTKILIASRILAMLHDSDQEGPVESRQKRESKKNRAQSK
jgi:DNA-binding transcriptional MerR regulator